MSRGGGEGREEVLGDHVWGENGCCFSDIFAYGSYEMGLGPQTGVVTVRGDLFQPQVLGPNAGGVGEDGMLESFGFNSASGAAQVWFLVEP